MVVNNLGREQISEGIVVKVRLSSPFSANKQVHRLKYYSLSPKTKKKYDSSFQEGNIFLFGTRWIPLTTFRYLNQSIL